MTAFSRPHPLFIALVLACAAFTLTACAAESTPEPTQPQPSEPVAGAGTDTSGANPDAPETPSEPTQPEPAPAEPEPVPSESDAAGITLAELATHNTKEDCWVGYKGKVYDVTEWLPRHPGGVTRISQHCGTATEFEDAFTRQHRGRQDSRLEREATVMGDLA